MKLSFLGICLAACTVVLIAQDDAAYQGWMKTVNSQMGALRKNDTKTGPEAVASAEKIADIYGQMSTYWSAKGASDAAKLSTDGKEAADALIAAAKAGDSEKANAAFKQIGGTCKSCHDAHREKTESGFKIK